MRLCTGRDYKRMGRGSRKFIGKWLTADFKIRSGPPSRLGITVKRRFGCACKRNRFKRLVREVFRHAYPSFSVSFDLSVRPRTEAVKAEIQNIRDELLEFIGLFESSTQVSPHSE